MLADTQLRSPDTCRLDHSLLPEDQLDPRDSLHDRLSEDQLFDLRQLLLAEALLVERRVGRLERRAQIDALAQAQAEGGGEALEVEQVAAQRLALLGGWLRLRLERRLDHGLEDHLELGEHHFRDLPRRRRRAGDLEQLVHERALLRAGLLLRSCRPGEETGRELTKAEELGQMVRDAVAVNPEQKVIVRGDRATQYANVVQVLDICKQAGIQEPYLDTVLE